MKRPTTRITSLALAAILAASGVAAIASSASAESSVTPDFGPVAGGTHITVTAPPSDLTPVLVEAGGLNSYIVTADGTALAVGSAYGGALGQGGTWDDTVIQTMPTAMSVPAGVDITAITAGQSFAFVQTESDGVYGWGDSPAGADGTQAYADSATLTPLTMNGVAVTKIDTGSVHSLALGADGLTYAFGLNAAGELGDGTTTEQHSTDPAVVALPSGVTFTEVEAAPGQFNNNDNTRPLATSYALGSDGNVWAWGDNGLRLGDGQGLDRLTPVQVKMPAEAGDVVAYTTGHVLASTYYNGYALDSNGDIWGWGTNFWGQLGNGAGMQSRVPTKVTAPEGVKFTAIDGAGVYVLALGDDGNVYSWGRNIYGELGNGTISPNSNPNFSNALPRKIASPDGVTFSSISAGPTSALAIGSDGNVYAWGNSDDSRIGLGEAGGNIPVPTVMQLPTRVVTGVTLDGLPATHVVDNGDGTASGVTPAHAAGPVDVVITTQLSNWSGEQSVTIPDGFTYLDDSSASPSASASPDVTPSGEPSDFPSEPAASLSVSVSTDTPTEPSADATSGADIDTGGESGSKSLLAGVGIAVVVVGAATAAGVILYRRRHGR